MFDTEETTAAPPQLQPGDFEQLREALGLKGPLAAADWLCEKLEANGDYPALFYAILMKTRIELGASPFPAGPASEIPAEHHEVYEEAIRTAGRRVGQLFLAKNDFPRAWTYFNMLAEPQPVVDALNAFHPGPDEEIQPFIEVALHQQLNIPKAFDLIVDRYGICNAITTYSGIDFSRQPAGKQHCVKSLVEALHRQLSERLRNDIETRGETIVPGLGLPEMLEGRPFLFAEDAYHIDTSHLQSVVQFSMELDECRQRKHAGELALYGSLLGSPYQTDLDPPFEEGYRDYKIYFDTLNGINVEAGLKHFRDKIDPAFEQEFTLPAEIYTNLLLKLNRQEEAREIAKKYLAGVQGRQMASPGAYELCLQSKDYEGLAEAAKQRADGVSYLAALVAK